MSRPVFRFAPSPNGRLHLGHAFSALLNQMMAEAVNGRLLLRIEDIDRVRCAPEFEAGIYDDLNWLGVSYETPVRRQSDHFADYAHALARLQARGLVYPAFLTRKEVRAQTTADWPKDPDGTPLYPTFERDMEASERQRRVDNGERHAWRLNMHRALQEVGDILTWEETGDGQKGIVQANPAVWGDVILSRSDAPASYHLAATLDDAVQGVTHVVRGLDLFSSTSIHRLLQHLLDLPEPVYHHHRLITAPDGRKLAKSNGDKGLHQLRAEGWTPGIIRSLLNL